MTVADIAVLTVEYRSIGFRKGDGGKGGVMDDVEALAAAGASIEKTGVKARQAAGGIGDASSAMSAATVAASRNATAAARLASAYDATARAVGASSGAASASGAAFNKAADDLLRWVAGLERANIAATKTNVEILQMSRAFAVLSAEERSAALATAGMADKLALTKTRAGGVAGAIRGLGGVFKHAFGGLIAFGAVAAIAEFSRSIVDANRDMQKMLNTLNAASGSMEQAKSEFSFLAGLANKLGTDLQGSADGYARLSVSAKSAGISTAQLHTSFTGLSEGFAATGRSGDEMNRFLVQMEQGLSQGTLHMRDLRAMAQSFPSAFEIAGEAAQRMGGSLDSFLKNGGLPAEQFFVTFSEIVHEKFAKAAEEASNTLIGQLNRIKNALFEAKTSGDVLAPLTAAFKALADELNSDSGRQHIQDLVKNIVDGFKAALKAVVLFIQVLPELIAAIKLLATVIAVRLVAGAVAKAAIGFGALTKAVKEFMAVQAAANFGTAIAGEGRRIGVAAIGARMATKLGVIAPSAAAGTEGIVALGAGAASAILPITALFVAIGGIAYAVHVMDERLAEQEAKFKASVKSTTDAAASMDALTKSTEAVVDAASVGGVSFSQMTAQIDDNAAAIVDSYSKQAAAAIVLAKAQDALNDARHPNMANRLTRETGNVVAITYETQKVKEAQDALDALNRSTASLKSANTDLYVQMSSQLSPALVDSYNKANPPKSFFGGMTSSADTLIGRLRELVGLQNQVDNKSLAQLALEGKGFSSYSAGKQVSLEEAAQGEFITSLTKKHDKLNVKSNVDQLNALLAQANKTAAFFPNDAAVQASAANAKKIVDGAMAMAKAVDAAGKHRVKSTPLAGLVQEYKRLVAISPELTKQTSELAKEQDKLNKLGDEAIRKGAKLADVTAEKSKALEQFNKNQAESLALQKAQNAATMAAFRANLQMQTANAAAQGKLSSQAPLTSNLESSNTQQMLQLQQSQQTNIAQMLARQQMARAQGTSQGEQTANMIGKQIGLQKAADLQRQNDLLEEQNKLWENQGDALGAVKAGFQDWVNAAHDAASQVRQAIGQTMDSFVDMVSTGLETGKFDFKSFAVSVLKQIEQIIVRMLVMKAAMEIMKLLGINTGPGNSKESAQAMSKAASNLEFAGVVVGLAAYVMSNAASKLQTAAEMLFVANTTSMFAANGAAFNESGNVVPFARGGVVHQPTLFAFAGGTGLMGEAGPEAVMPLKRDSQGRLGVRGGGGGSNVSIVQNITVENNGQTQEQTQTAGQQTDAIRAFNKRMSDVAKSTIVEEQRPGGSLWRMAHA